MELRVNAAPFRPPNFVTITALGSEGKLDVGHLSDENASAYWDDMKGVWLKHVKARRKALKEGGDGEV
jgi:hypothetical protein